MTFRQEYAAAWDFGASTAGSLFVNAWYNGTGTTSGNGGGSGQGPGTNYRLPGLVNMAAKAWWLGFVANYTGRFLPLRYSALGWSSLCHGHLAIVSVICCPNLLRPPLPTHAGSPPTSVVPPVDLLGVSSMPKPSSKLTLDFSSLLGPLFYTWVVQLLVSFGTTFGDGGRGRGAER